MHPESLSKLSQAVTAVVPMVPPLPTSPPENVAKCRGLSLDSKSHKTNPNLRTLALKPRQHSAITLLFAGHSVAAAARILKINPRTIFRWLDQPHFRAAMKDQTPELHLPPSRLMQRQARCYEKALQFI